MGVVVEHLGAVREQRSFPDLDSRQDADDRPVAHIGFRPDLAAPVAFATDDAANHRARSDLRAPFSVRRQQAGVEPQPHAVPELSPALEGLEHLHEPLALLRPIEQGPRRRAVGGTAENRAVGEGVVARIEIGAGRHG